VLRKAINRQQGNKSKQLMALDIFLKLGDVKGESVDKTHRKEIDVVNWSWGMNAGSAQVGDGAGSGKGEVRDLEITKYVDTSSPKLMLACCDGTHFSSALLTVRKSGRQKPVEYLKFKLETVFIAGVSVGGFPKREFVREQLNNRF
jgi:type VI secretion system secreted protein Hcp